MTLYLGVRGGGLLDFEEMDCLFVVLLGHEDLADAAGDLVGHEFGVHFVDFQELFFGFFDVVGLEVDLGKAEVRENVLGVLHEEFFAFFFVPGVVVVGEFHIVVGALLPGDFVAFYALDVAVHVLGVN